jgi:hypothetical protein
MEDWMNEDGDVNFLDIPSPMIPSPWIPKTEDHMRYVDSERWFGLSVSDALPITQCIEKFAEKKVKNWVECGTFGVIDASLEDRIIFESVQVDDESGILIES